MGTDGFAEEDEGKLDSYWDAVGQDEHGPADGVDPGLTLIVRQLHSREDNFDPHAEFAERLWGDLMRSSELALPVRALPETMARLPIGGSRRTLIAEQPNEPRASWSAIAFATIGVAAILFVAVLATSQLSRLQPVEEGLPAWNALQGSEADSLLVGSWIVRTGASRDYPPLLITFGADGTIMVTDRADDNTGHGNWVVTSDGVSFEYATVEVNSNDEFLGTTTWYGEVLAPTLANEWSGVYRNYLTTPSGNVPSGTADMEISGERIVAEPPQPVDQGPATPAPKS